MCGSMFLNSPEEVENIIKECKKNDIKIISSVFQRSSDEVKDIVEIANEYGLSLDGSLFRNSPEETRSIVATIILYLCSALYRKRKIYGAAFRSAKYFR